MAKIPNETVEQLRELMAPADTPERRARYLAGDFPRADRVQDLDKRYRWDLFWEKVNIGHLLPGPTLKDAHIDTALRKVVPPLKER